MYAKFMNSLNSKLIENDRFSASLIVSIRLSLMDG